MVVTNKINYGCFELKGMMLHAHQLISISNEKFILNAKINEEFSRVGTILNLDLNKYE
jgi:tRNA pseudouridine65 synthase